MPRKILIIEDEPLVLEAYRDALSDADLSVLTAETLLEALAVMETNPDIALVALDGCFPRDVGEDPVPEPGRPCSGEKLIANSPRFQGLIIACSSEAVLNRRMRTEGATHESAKGDALCRLIRKLLGLPPAPS